MNIFKYICLFSVLVPQLSFAEKHELVRKLAVFPIFVEGSLSQDPAVADAWWELREAIVNDGFFVVATRQLMVNRGVFQARKDLGRADAIMLAQVIEAEGLVSLYIEDQLLKLKAYDGRNGQPLFQLQFRLDPSLPLASQIKKAAAQLGTDFQRQFPYQAYQLTEMHERMARIFVGNTEGLSQGDEVQWLRIPAVDEKPLFEDSKKLQVIARGKILEKDGAYLRVQVLNYSDYKQIQENSLIRIPQLTENGPTTQKDVPEYKGQNDPHIKAHQIKSEGQSPATTALGFLVGLGAFILLAF